jgi:hypothetical protein
VGRHARVSSCALSAPAGGLEPAFVDHRGGADPETLRRGLAGLAPEVVVVFEPEVVPPGVLDDLDALTLGVATDPGPHPGAVPVRVAVDQFDRIAGAGPWPAAAGDRLPVWRSLVLPVDDRFYAPVGPWRRPPRPVFVGSATEHRERWLIDAKHEFDLLHVASGLHGDGLRALFASTDVAVNVHRGPRASFEHRVCVHLAAGHLVVSEPLSPRHGLEPGVDLLEVRSPEQLLRCIRSVRAVPQGYDAVRRHGRRTAERFRASRVWPRLLGDLMRDVRVFGTERTRTR